MTEVGLAPPPAELDDSAETRAEPPASTRRKRRVKGKLFVQFAANEGYQLADAAELVKPWVDGVDLNCGTF